METALLWSVAARRVLPGLTVNYGWGVSGNAALNTVVMCPDLRKRIAGQGTLTCGSGMVQPPAPPGRTDRLAQVPPGRPAQLPGRGAGRGHRARRVPGPAPLDHRRPGVAGDLADQGVQ